MPIEVRDRDLERSMHILSAYSHRRTDTGGDPSPSSPCYRDASPYGQEDTITYLLNNMASIVRMVVVLPNVNENRFMPTCLREGGRRPYPQYILRPQCTTRLVTEQAVFLCAQLLSALSIASMIPFFHPQLKLPGLVHRDPNRPPFSIHSRSTPCEARREALSHSLRQK